MGLRRDALLFNDPRAVYALMRERTASQYIDPMELSTTMIEDFCSRGTLHVGRRANDAFVEDKTSPPLMVSYFMYYLYCYQSMPTQRQFAEFYRGLNEVWVKTNLTIDQLDAFDGRLARFYASIMREFHFYHLVKEADCFENVCYSLKLDIEEKTDVWVEKDGNAYGIQLRVGTRNAKKYADKKSGRGFTGTEATLIDFPINLDDAKKVRTQKDVFLFYGDTYIVRLLATIEALVQAGLQKNA